MIDPSRHQTVFSPDEFGSRRVDIIGAGATGSRVVLGLANLGLENLHIWDDDIVKEHNVANQVYGNQHVGLKKVDALSELILESTGCIVEKHAEKHTGQQYLGQIVFLLTDTMESRKSIWNGAIKYKPHTKLMIETRMGVDEGRIYSIDPIKPNHIKEWEATLCEDKEAEASSCGASISVGATSEILSGFATWQLIRWFSNENQGGEELENEIIYMLRPTMTLTRSFK